MIIIMIIIIIMMIIIIFTNTMPNASAFLSFVCKTFHTPFHR